MRNFFHAWFFFFGGGASEITIGQKEMVWVKKKKGRDLGRRGGNLEPARAMCHVLDTRRSNGRCSHFGNLAASSLLDAWLRASGQ